MRSTSVSMEIPVWKARCDQPEKDHVYSYRRLRPNAADKTHQVAQGGADCVRRKAQFFERKVHAVDPEGWVTKRFGSCRVPAAKRREGNFLALHPKCVNTHLVSARVGLVSFN